MSDCKTMTKWEVGQCLIKIADIMSEVETDLWREGRSEYAGLLRPMRLSIGDIFNEINEHGFLLPSNNIKESEVAYPFTIRPPKQLTATEVAKRRKIWEHALQVVAACKELDERVIKKSEDGV